MLRSEFLLTVSEEVSDLAASAAEIQVALGHMLQGADAGSSAGFWHIQEIDRLQQTLDDLSAILRSASEDDGARLDVERIASAARLGAIRERLRGSTGDAATVQDAGIVAFF